MSLKYVFTIVNTKTKEIITTNQISTIARIVGVNQGMFSKMRSGETYIIREYIVECNTPTEWDLNNLNLWRGQDGK